MSRMFLFIFLSFSFASHCSELTLEQAEKEFENSPRYLKSKSQTEEARWKKIQAYSGFLPDVYFKSYHMFHQKYVYADINMGGSPASVPSLVPATIYSLGFQLPLFDGLSNIDRFSSAMHFENSAMNEHEWTNFQGKREVLLAYYKALTAKILKEVAKQNLNALEDHLHDVQLFKQAGMATKYEVLRVEVQKSEAESEVLNAEDNEFNLNNRLVELIGSENKNQTLTGSLPELKLDLIDSIDENFNSRADLVSLRERVVSLDKMSSSDSKFYIPKIGLYGEYQKYNNRNYDLTGEDGFRSSYNIGVQLVWNLFDGMKSISKDQITSEQKYQLEKTLRMAELKSKNDIAFWKRKFKYFVNVYNARSNDVKKAEESVRLAKEGRKVGTRTNTDLLDAEAELYRAKAQAIHAQLGTIDSLVNLELSTGKKIYNF